VPPIDELTRIEPIHLDRLSRQGIFTTGLLLEVSETPTRRQTLADQVDATTNDVLAWRDEAQLLNLPGMTPTDHRVLMQSGFEGLSELGEEPFDAFTTKVARGATELNLEPPQELMLHSWWEQARTLEGD
jgi:hypothetical protein